MWAAPYWECFWSPTGQNEIDELAKDIFLCHRPMAVPAAAVVQVVHAVPSVLDDAGGAAVDLFHRCLSKIEKEPADSCGGSHKMSPEGQDSFTRWMSQTESSWKKPKAGNAKPPKASSDPVLMALYIRYDLAVPPAGQGVPATVRPNSRRKVMYVWSKYRRQGSVPLVRMRMDQTGATGRPDGSESDTAYQAWVISR
jgi:hypothetical protein